MFLGFQKSEDGYEFIAYASENREDVVNNPFMKFTSVSETNEPVELINGKFYVGEDEISKVKQAQELAQAKGERSEAVSKITVEVDGMVFDGDETSQQRMSRSIVALEDGETMPWVLYDNTIAEVSKEQLKQVLRLAGQKQSELWIIPYTSG